MESERQAVQLSALIEETLQDVERGKLVVPADADVAAFFLSGGKVASKPKPVPNPAQAQVKPTTIVGIFDTYAETLTPGAKETNTIYTEALHGRHFKRVFGADR